MSNEEFERQAEFILQQQARFETSLEKERQHSAEDWAKQRERNAEFMASLSILRDALISLTHHVERHDENIKSHEREMAEIRRANAERVELGKEMDARLNTLMLVVERHISDHQ